MRTTRLPLLLFVALAGCADEHGGQIASDDVLTVDEELLESIREEYGVADEFGNVSLSGDAALASSLIRLGHRWTVEDVRRDRAEAERLDSDLTLEWTREYLAKLEGPRPPPASKYIFGATLAEEVAGAKNQLGYMANDRERQRLGRLPAAEQLQEAEKHLAKLKGPSPPSYPYLWSGAGNTLEDETAFVEKLIEGLRLQVSYEDERAARLSGAP